MVEVAGVTAAQVAVVMVAVERAEAERATMEMQAQVMVVELPAEGVAQAEALAEAVPAATWGWLILRSARDLGLGSMAEADGQGLQSPAMAWTWQRPLQCC